MPTSKTQYHSISGPTLPGRSGSVATFSVPPFHAPSRFGYGRPEAGPDLGARRTRDAVHGKRTMPPQSSESPAKKQSKWSAEEDALIIDLRGGGMKWEDISKRLPGRSAISCRLHYQNYLERRSEWDEERKNKLARLYERFKQEMWAKVAEEMAIPWRAAEAMHWQLGESDMAKRAGVTPFCLTAVNVEGQAGAARIPPSRGHHHSHSNSHSHSHPHSYSHTSFPRETMGQTTYGARGSMPPASTLPPLPSSHNRPSSSRRDSYPRNPQAIPPATEHHENRYNFTGAHPGPPPPPPPPQMHAHGDHCLLSKHTRTRGRPHSSQASPNSQQA
ncbi:Myb-like DNA-binding domain-containing protein [Microdochium nivale]|nr:Myb-like DNA-binding domain-containing protein [Microdochium nivale]